MNDRLVIKIGGSLLATPGAMGRVRRWLDETRLEGQARLLIAGGGPAVDGLRVIDQANPLPARASHNAAIELMDTNTRLLACWLPGVRLLEAQHAKRASSGDYAVPVGVWLDNDEPTEPGERLTVGWHTTSDSIAARFAACSGADLFVVKHSCANTYDTPKAVASAGIVDPEFSRIASQVSSVRVFGLPSS